MKEMKKVTLAMILTFLVATAPAAQGQEAESAFGSNPFAWLSAWLGEAVSDFFTDEEAAPEGRSNLAGEEPEIHIFILPGG